MVRYCSMHTARAAGPRTALSNAALAQGTHPAMNKDQGAAVRLQQTRQSRAALHIEKH